MKTGNKYSIVVTAINEEESLEDTVIGINELKLINEFEIIISTTLNATPGCLNMARKMQEKFPENTRIYFQKKPYIAAAILESISEAKFENVVIMSSDGETDFHYLPEMISAHKSNVDIVCTSRWLANNSFKNYGFVKLHINKFAQRICRYLYKSNLTDFTFGFRIYRKTFLTSFNFKETKHPFFLEALLIPIKNGAKCAEIAVSWKPRVEGESVVKIIDLISYGRPLLRNLFWY